MLLVLASALLLAQTQGLMHRVVHIGTHHTVASHGHIDHIDHDGHGAGDEVNWVLRLFAAHDDGGTQCRLLDQSGHSASLPSVPLPGLPFLAFARHVVCHAALPPAPAVVLTWARGPPAFR